VVEAATPPVGPQGRPLVAWPPKTPNGLAPCPRSTARKTSLAQYSLRASERVRLCAIAAAFSRSCSRRDAKALPLRTLTPADTTWCALAREQMRRARRRPRGRAVARDFSQYDGALNLRPRACCARARRTAARLAWVRPSRFDPGRWSRGRYPQFAEPPLTPSKSPPRFGASSCLRWSLRCRVLTGVPKQALDDPRGGSGSPRRHSCADERISTVSSCAISPPVTTSAEMPQSP
jgi:hypothetical protein